MKANPAERERRRTLLAQGLSAREVASRCGVSRGAILNAIKRYNLPHRPAGGQYGALNHAWRGGPPPQIEKDGYIKVYVPTHIFCDCRGYVFEHRLAMEKKLGRHLDPEEVVHHKDYDRANNLIDNLMLFRNQKAHIAYHIRTDPVFQPKQAKDEDIPF